MWFRVRASGMIATHMATEAQPGDMIAAGRDALACGAWAEARAAFERALAEDETPEALEGLSWAAWWLGDPDVLLEARERAYHRYRDRGDLRAAARMATWLGTDSVDFRGEFAVASGWLARARRLLEGHGEAVEYGWLCVHEAEQRIHAEDTASARALGVEATALGRRLGRTDLEMMGLSVEGVALVTEGEVDAGLRRLDEAAAAALGGEFEALPYVVFSCCFVIYACERARDYDRAAQWCRKAAEFAERADVEDLNRYCRAHHAGMLMWRGLWREAEAELVATRDALPPTRRPPLAAEVIVRLGELRRRQGRLDEAEELFAQVEEHPLAVLGRAELCLDRGDPLPARELVERLLREMPETSRTERAVGLELIVRAYVAVADDAAAAAALAELRAIADAVRTEPLRACVSFSAGVTEAAAGDHEAARRSFEDAAYLFQRSGAPFEGGRARLELAQTLAALGRAEHASEQAAAAAAVLKRIGARREVERADALLGRVSERPRGGGRAGLTGREREVLALVAEGRSDKAIAAALVVSEHTVHRHVANILAKLSCRSRSAAVAEGLRRDLI
jgi:LuxR family maltose regulon positive regulatory protein